MAVDGSLWIAFALLAALTKSISAVMLKVIRTRYVPNTYAMVAVQALLGSLSVVLLPFSNISTLPPGTIFLGLAIGFLAMASYIPLYFALAIEEVSRVTPLLQLTPVAVLVLAVLFLGETLSAPSYAAFAIMVAGALLVSLRKTSLRIGFSRALPLAMLTVLFAALSSFLLKVVAGTGVLSMMIFLGMGNSILGAILMALPYFRKQVKTSLKKTGRTGWALLLGEYALSVITAILLILAIINGPVSLVAAIYNSNTVLVFLIAIAASLFIPKILKEELKTATVIQKSVGILLVLAGIYVLYSF